MTYSFESQAMQFAFGLIPHPVFRTRVAAKSLPYFVRGLKVELEETTCEYPFENEQITRDDSVSVGLRYRSPDEIFAMVDWSVAILNNLDPTSPISVGDVLEDTGAPFFRDISPTDSLLGVFEMWNDIDEESSVDAPHISHKRFPGCQNPALKATAANLLGAIGLAKVDQVLAALERADLPAAFLHLTVAAEFASAASGAYRADIGWLLWARQQQSHMKRIALARHSRAAISAPKSFVRTCWEKWQQVPTTYPSVAAFARDMQDKFPDDLKSHAVITRWVRGWTRGGG